MRNNSISDHILLMQRPGAGWQRRLVTSLMAVIGGDDSGSGREERA